MNYNSTRSKDFSCTAAEAIKKGLAFDGGLYVPECFPKLTDDEIKSFVNLSYQERAFIILSKYLTDFSDEEIKHCVNSAYNEKSFDSKDITPIKKLNDEIYFLELWHGKTCAFKDVALQILPHFLTLSIKKTGDTHTAVILVATSGDTGKAALEGFSNVKGTKIAVFYPSNGVSNIQKAQMITQEGENVAVSGIEGNFDDAQNGVKKIFTDKAFNEELEKKGYVLSSANSINWGRLLPQIVYYFSAYADILKNNEISFGEKINFVVPTGNFGDILAGYYAKLMGLPINKLICASNKNNVLTDFIKTGTYNKNREFFTTASPSMDILISSNLERFIYNISGNDSEKISGFMKELAENGTYTIDDDMKSKISDILWGDFCDDESTKATIKEIYEDYGYTIDTHTAVGKNVCDKYLKETNDTAKTVILSTASPFKFNNTVISAISGEEKIKDKDDFELLNILSDISKMEIPKNLAKLNKMEKRFNGSINKDDMKEFVREFNK